MDTVKYLPEGTLLQGGKYRIVREISSGGFGNTYEGVHSDLDTRVAIKEFFVKTLCDRNDANGHITIGTRNNRDLVERLRKKFYDEARAVFKMRHDNIVRVMDVFEENNTAYYVMEYVDGQTLSQIISARGPLPEREAVSYIMQVADALRYVHSIGRLHLDVKPANVMVDAHGHALLIDFGASKHYDEATGENTTTLMGINTPGYAPYEQMMRSFSHFSPSADIYALGATLYKLVTGITPPDAQVLMGRLAEVAPLPSAISPSTRNTIRQAMQLYSDDRLQTIDQFLAMLSGTSTTSTQTPIAVPAFNATMVNRAIEVEPETYAAPTRVDANDQTIVETLQDHQSSASQASTPIYEGTSSPDSDKLYTYTSTDRQFFIFNRRFSFLMKAYIVLQIIVSALVAINADSFYFVAAAILFLLFTLTLHSCKRSTFYGVLLSGVLLYHILSPVLFLLTYLAMRSKKDNKSAWQLIKENSSTSK